MAYQNRSLGNTNNWRTASNKDPYLKNSVPYKDSDFENGLCYDLGIEQSRSFLDEQTVDWEKPFKEFNKKFQREIVYYGTVINGKLQAPYYALATSLTRPVMCLYKPENTPSFNSKRPEEEKDCPCDCKEVVTKKTMFINKVKSNENDKPILIDNEKIVCDSKDSKKSYSVPCDSNTDITQALNQLSGLMDCPCDCRKVITKETFYLSDVKLANSIAIPVNVKETVCETNSTNNRKLPCDVLNQAVNLNDEVGSDFSSFVKNNEEVITYSIAGIVALVLLKGVLS